MTAWRIGYRYSHIGGEAT